MLMKSRIDRRSLLGAGAASLMLAERLGRSKSRYRRLPLKCPARRPARP